MDPITRLMAIEEIRALKARYFRFIDTKLWDRLPDLFTVDLRVITPEGKIWIEGGAAYAASLKYGLERAVSCHQGFSHEIEFLPDGTARGIWAMQDIITWEDRHPREGWKAINGNGHYHETYRIDKNASPRQNWRIATLSLTRLKLDIDK